MNALQVSLVTAVVLGTTGIAVAQETTRVSVDSSGAEGNDMSSGLSISADGQIVAFFSYASNLVAGDKNGTYDVFVHDRTTGVTKRVSVDSSGAEGNGRSFDVSISADGQIVAFISDASNLIPGDTNGSTDVFVHDRTTGVTELVSVDSSGVEGNAFSGYPVISADGCIVAFMSSASNLIAGDTNGTSDVFVHDRSTGLTERVSVDSSGAEGNGFSGNPAISADGQIVALISDASNFVAGDTNGLTDVFVHDRSTGLTERVSVDSSGAEGNRGSDNTAISADGQIVVFKSLASNLVAGDTNGTVDVFVHDRSTELTERVSVDSSGAEGNGRSEGWAISADGQVVGFQSDATNLVSGDSNGVTDAFVHDRSTGITQRVSVDSSGAEGNGASNLTTSISADGQIVAFSSIATNLVDDDANGFNDVFVHDSSCGVDASWSNYGAGFPGAIGVPSLTAQNDPVLGTTLNVDVGSSATAWTLAAILVGDHEASIPMRKGGDLLVVPLIVNVIALPTWGLTLDEDIDDDPLLCGLEFFAQTLIVDPGAAKGQSASAGLKLVLGY